MLNGKFPYVRFIKVYSATLYPLFTPEYFASVSMFDDWKHFKKWFQQLTLIQRGDAVIANRARFFYKKILIKKRRGVKRILYRLIGERNFQSNAKQCRTMCVTFQSLYRIFRIQIQFQLLNINLSYALQSLYNLHNLR